MAKGKRNGTANLIPGNERSPEEARKLGHKGGVKSGETRRKQKTFRETFKALLDTNIPIGILPEEIQAMAGDKIDFRNAIALATANKAIRGDVAAAVFVRDTIGEKPTDKMEVEGSGKFEITVRIDD